MNTKNGNWVYKISPKVYSEHLNKIMLDFTQNDMLFQVVMLISFTYKSIEHYL